MQVWHTVSALFSIINLEFPQSRLYNSTYLNNVYVSYTLGSVSTMCNQLNVAIFLLVRRNSSLDK